MLRVSDCACAHRVPRFLVAPEDPFWFPEALQAAGRRGAHSGCSLRARSLTHGSVTSDLSCSNGDAFLFGFLVSSDASDLQRKQSVRFWRILVRETSAAGAAQDLHRTPVRSFQQIPLLHIQDPILPTEFCFPPDVRLGFERECCTLLLFRHVLDINKL